MRKNAPKFVTSPPEQSKVKVKTKAKTPTSVAPPAGRPTAGRSTAGNSTTGRSTAGYSTTGRPAAVTPTTVRPTAGRSTAGNSTTGRPTAVAPTTVRPAAVTPAAVTPAAVTPAAVTPAAVTPAAVTPAAVTPAAVTPTAVRPTAVAATSEASTTSTDNVANTSQTPKGFHRQPQLLTALLSIIKAPRQHSPKLGPSNIEPNVSKSTCQHCKLTLTTDDDMIRHRQRCILVPQQDSGSAATNLGTFLQQSPSTSAIDAGQLIAAATALVQRQIMANRDNYKSSTIECPSTVDDIFGARVSAFKMALSEAKSEADASQNEPICCQCEVITGIQILNAISEELLKLMAVFEMLQSYFGTTIKTDNEGSNRSSADHSDITDTFEHISMSTSPILSINPMSQGRLNPENSLLMWLPAGNLRWSSSTCLAMEQTGTSNPLDLEDFEVVPDVSQLNEPSEGAQIGFAENVSGGARDLSDATNELIESLADAMKEVM